MTTQQLEELTTPSLRELIRERLELSQDPDPRAVVADLLDDLTPEHREQALRAALRMMAAALARQLRLDAFRPANPNASTKWDRVKEAVKARPDLFAQRICVGHGPDGPLYKFLADCTARDLTHAADEDRAKANGMLRRAEQYEQLARKLKGGRTVKSLGLKTVEGIFNA